MQTTHFRNKLYIHRRKIATVIFSLCVVFTARAQRNVEINNPNYDSRFLSYGFLIGLHTSAYQLKYSDDFLSRDLADTYSISPKWSNGFSLGFIVNMNMSEFLDVRLLPKVAFYEHAVEFRRFSEPTETQLVETTVVELPLMFKYKSERRGNTRMYLVGGLKPGIEASGKNELEGNTNILPIKDTNLSMDLGFGIDLYFPLFKFSPEIRFSKGVTNMLGGSNDVSKGIDRLNTNTVNIYFLFQ